MGPTHLYGGLISKEIKSLQSSHKTTTERMSKKQAKPYIGLVDLTYKQVEDEQNLITCNTH